MSPREMDECPHFLSLLGSEVVEGELEDWLGDDDAVGLPPDAESEETRLCRLLAWARGRIIEVIRAKCHQCTSGAIDGISDCTSFTCALYPWRAGTAATVVRGTSVHDPEYARELEKAACQDTEFKPAYSRDEAGDAFAEIDVLVLPSLWLENSPVVIQEAFATGCPVLTSDLGGMRELVQDGVNGRLFPPGDAKALAKIMEEVCSNPGMIDKWREGITPPRPIEDDAESIEALYGELLRR